MRFAVLTSPDSWYWHDLLRAAGDRHQLECLSFTALRTTLGEIRSSRVAAGPHDLTHFDGVLVRSMPLGSLEQVVFRMNALAQLEENDTVVLNPARGLETAIDKYLTLARLAERGLPVPDTITCQSWRDAMEAFALLDEDVVVKPIFGGEGRGITRITDPALALRAFQMLEQLGAVIYLQRYIAHDGFDCRLLVIGKQVLGVRRLNETDWRTNVSRGARAERLEVSESLATVARRAASAIACPLAGVDLLPAKDGRSYLLEVNAVPGWKALASTLGLDVAGLVLDLMEELVQRNQATESS